MGFLLKIAAFVVLLGTLVFVHELGHFLAAKFFRVKVLRFSLGFGPKIWGFTRGETEYQLAALPLGGYVRMAGEDPSQPLEAADKGRGFSEQAPWKRAVIAFAGPAVNLLLPPLVFFAINLAPQKQMPAVVGFVLPGEPADVAGIQSGDRIVSVDGVPTRSFDEMKEVVEARPGKAMDVVVERHGEKLTLRINAASEAEKTVIETTQKGKIGIVAGKLPAYVGIVPGSRAAQAGVKTFDRVVKVNGQPIVTRTELDSALKAVGAGALEVDVERTPVIDLKTAPLATGESLHFSIPAGPGELGFDTPDLYLREVDPASRAYAAGLRANDKIIALGGTPVTSGPRFEKLLEDRKTLDLTVLRDGQKLNVTYDPPMVKHNDPVQGPIDVPDYGFAFHPRIYASEPFSDAELVAVSYPLGAAFVRGFDQTVMLTRGMVLALGGLFTGRVSTHTIGGPIMLYQLAGAASERGLIDFMKMFAVISINLGLMNLIPLPVLDGFHILVSGIEGISRRTLSLRFREIASYVGVAMLLALMLLAFWNDVTRTFLQ